MTEPELHYFCKPNQVAPASVSIDFMSLAEFLTDEASCKVFWS